MKKLKGINLFKNIYILYFIFLISLLHAGWFLYHKNVESIIIFATSCLAIYLINKNMTFVLGLSIIIVDTLYILNTKEGFEEKDSIINSIIDSNNSIIDSNMDISNNDLTNNDLTNNDLTNDTETMSNYMEDKPVIEKLNPIVIDSIKKMNTIYIEELNKNINALNNLKDP